MRRTYWAGDLHPGQVAVFHFNYKSQVMCSPQGVPGSIAPLVFAGTPEAESYAQNYVEANPKIGCRLYGPDGTCLGEVVNSATLAAANPRAQAKRDLWIGLLGFLLIPCGMLFDRWVGWSLFLGLALGTKFTMMGVVKLSDGIAGLIKTKPVSTP